MADSGSSGNGPGQGSVLGRTKQRKRKRLNQVVDKLNFNMKGGTTNNNNNNNRKEDEDAACLPPSPSPSAGLMSPVERREERRARKERTALCERGDSSNLPATSHVFRFDSLDRERYYSAICEEAAQHQSSLMPPEDTDVFSHSPDLIRHHTHLHVNMPPSSRCYCAHCLDLNRSSVPPGGISGGIPLSPVSPLTPSAPLSPLPGAADTLLRILPDLFRRRCHSDSDLQLWGSEGVIPAIPHLIHVPPSTGRKGISGGKVRPLPRPLCLPGKGGSLESDTSTPQDSPLDLSIRGGSSCSPSPSPSPRDPIPWIVTTVASSVVGRVVSLGEYPCPICGQTFSVHDRLTKHIASRHKASPSPPRTEGVGATTRSYACDVCRRSFARSDMLTRHMRLHTGLKPYTCRVCGQVFSRSDHLSTHQRTHTGEKPYRCPQCPYAACRRDMITRHMRTHTRSSSGVTDDDNTSPMSPSIALSTLSVQSPSPMGKMEKD